MIENLAKMITMNGIELTYFRARKIHYHGQSKNILQYFGKAHTLTLFQLGRDNFYHRNSISRDTA